jgi:hypothetical protein
VLLSGLGVYLSFGFQNGSDTAVNGGREARPADELGPGWLGLLIGVMVYLTYQIVFVVIGVAASIAASAAGGTDLAAAVALMTASAASPAVAFIGTVIIGMTTISRIGRPIRTAAIASLTFATLALGIQIAFILVGSTDHLGTLDGIPVTTVFQSLGAALALVCGGLFLGPVLTAAIRWFARVVIL